MVRNQACQGALTQKQTLGSWFEPGAAYLSDCSVELPLRPSASAAPPLGPRSMLTRLRGWAPKVGGEPSCRSSHPPTGERERGEGSRHRGWRRRTASDGTRAAPSSRTSGVERCRAASDGAAQRRAVSHGSVWHRVASRSVAPASAHHRARRARHEDERHHPHRSQRCRRRAAHSHTKT